MADQLWFLDTLVTVHVPHGLGTDGVSLLESRARRGDSPPLHVHAEDEIFHVLDGRMTIRVGAEDHPVGQGGSLLAPAGVPHSYRIESEEARWLVVTARGDFERFVRSVGRPAPAAELPEPSAPPTADQERELAAISGRHRIELVGPPLT